MGQKRWGSRRSVTWRAEKERWRRKRDMPLAGQQRILKRNNKHLNKRRMRRRKGGGRRQMKGKKRRGKRKWKRRKRKGKRKGKRKRRKRNGKRKASFHLSHTLHFVSIYQEIFYHLRAAQRHPADRSRLVALPQTRTAWLEDEEGAV